MSYCAASEAGCYADINQIEKPEISIIYKGQCYEQNINF